jgi:hypothetical protein
MRRANRRASSWRGSAAGAGAAEATGAARWAPAPAAAVRRPGPVPEEEEGAEAVLPPGKGGGAPGPARGGGRPGCRARPAPTVPRDLRPGARRRPRPRRARLPAPEDRRRRGRRPLPRLGAASPQGGRSLRGERGRGEARLRRQVQAAEGCGRARGGAGASPPAQPPSRRRRIPARGPPPSQPPAARRRVPRVWRTRRGRRRGARAPGCGLLAHACSLPESGPCSLASSGKPARRGDSVGSRASAAPGARRPGRRLPGERARRRG